MNKRKFSSIAGFLAGIAFAFVAGAWAQSQTRVVWHWPDSLEAVHAAPKNHKVLFEDDHVRLLEVRVQPGETENMHGHIWPSVFAYDAVQPKGTNHIMDSDTQPHGREFEATRTFSRNISIASNSKKWTANQSSPSPRINLRP